MDFRRTFKYWVPVIFAMLFIFGMSTDTFSSKKTASIVEALLRYLAPSLSRASIVTIHGVIRKLAHLTEYFILGLLLFRAFRAGSPDQSSWRWASSSLAVIVLYAISDELHQTYVATRTASPVDVGIDTVGGFLAQCVTLLRYRWNEKKELESQKDTSP